MVKEKFSGLNLFRSETHEECAVVYQVTTNHYLFQPVTNVHPTPEDNFAIRKRDFESAQTIARNIGYTFLGVMHTHLPDHLPPPSDEDIKNAMGPWLNLVWHPESRTMTWFSPRGIVRVKSIAYRLG